MKKLLLILLFVFAQTLNVWAADVQVSWTPNSETNLAGYKVHWGTASRDYTDSTDVGNPAAVDNKIIVTLSGFTPGVTYYLAATAYDTDSFESDYSDEAIWTAPSGGAMPPEGVVNFEIPGLSEMAAGDYLLTVNPDHSIAVNALPGCPDECPADSLDGLSSGRYEVVINADGSHTITPIGNSAPTVSISVDSSQIIEGESVTITATASDLEGDFLTYDWYVDGVLDGSGSSIVLADLSVGSHSVYCQVDDGTGNVVNSSLLTITVLDGPYLSVPTSLTLTADYGDAEVSGNIAIANTGNGDMYWSASTTSGIFSLTPVSGVNNGVATVTADLVGLDPGDYYGDVIVTSSDTDNSPQTVQVQVTVAEQETVILIPVGPNDWSWHGGMTPSNEGVPFNGEPGYGSTNNIYFEKVGDAFTVSENARYLNVKLNFNSPSVLILQMRNDALSVGSWRRAMFSSFGDSWSTRSSLTGWFGYWGSNPNIHAENEFLNLQTGTIVEKSIDLTTNGFSFGDTCNGIGFSVYTGDPKVIFGDLSISESPLYSME